MIVAVDDLWHLSRPSKDATPCGEHGKLIAVQENGDPIFIAARPLNIIWKETIPGLFAAVSVTLEGYDDWQSGS